MADDEEFIEVFDDSSDDSSSEEILIIDGEEWCPEHRCPRHQCPDHHHKHHPTPPQSGVPTTIIVTPGIPREN